MLADNLIQEYHASGHPLGEAIRLEETDKLISLLRLRLNAAENELDLSPSSLKRLEAKLSEYHLSLQEKRQQLANDEVVQLVREVAAYLGIVLMRHAQATWRGGRSLWGTEVEVEGPIKSIKGTQRATKKFLVYPLGNQAASAWDAVTQSSPTLLYSTYLSMRRKTIKQKL